MAQTAITAIKPKNQKTVNNFIHWNEKYDSLVNDGKEESKAGYNAYEKAQNYWGLLPKYEQKNISKSVDTVHGCY